ncbi:Aureusidin synthase [Acorus gramineus]|uniref:Aureusidin synthase n=1 Tax=Acorus gramineus TaxID=55184 RepID=A0AAV9B0B5_ACOGR|nr:Aureusidin synthase [Acorus gramineus]
MDGKRWLSVVVIFFVLILAGLFLHDDLPEAASSSLSIPASLFRRDQQQQTTTSLPASFAWLMNLIQGIITGDDVNTNSDPHTRLGGAQSPNLTTCHLSLSDADRPVYCCPLKPESEEPIIDFEFPSPSDEPIKIRRPAHLVDEAYIAKYTEAVHRMRRLPPDHPHNFMRQANIHCIYCTGAYNQANSSALLKIHRSWFFFPWHRIFIYFHERILAKLIGDDTFALPFWNWDSPEGMVIPDIYMNSSLNDVDRDLNHLPPAVTDINFHKPVESGLSPEAQVSSNLAFMYNQMISGARKPELFMGCPSRAGVDGACDGPGTIELAPHNALHSWVGSAGQPEREDLGAFYSAARDPIFYAHHANIDRLWTVWEDLHGGRGVAGGEFLNDPDWLDSHFYFHDENARLVRVRVRDCLDLSKLRYRYEEVKHPWLDAKPKPSIPPSAAARRNMLLWQSIDFGPTGRTLDAKLRTSVRRPRPHRTKKEMEEEEEVLVVHGIDIKKDMDVTFDVYVNAVDEARTLEYGPKAREFAGTFVNVRHGVRLVRREGDSEMKMKSTLKLGISELLADLEADDDESILVTIVPRGGGTGVNTTVDGIRIEYIQ